MLKKKKKSPFARHWWLMSIILATWEAKIWRTVVQGQPKQIVHKTPSPKQLEQNGLEMYLE
jgi:hypothetical protein